ncbi:hypothetical protein [Sulfuritalea hydrogenivorans]|uniref:Lipoprotein n=1 Tax=Sulfuritalea hydrogenivorans sk43H TaxID=1223802 RepID=W0SH66_9PROT|nr:hypothetical protein [Sulfuritalea hydrogenivorans]MDK9713075.1 hypothetical protein [Sulfuritalea sp.]BAO29073.1 hypothetical protein SUTH_01273 [Sulfuritalea hydrogenivorans sk43H]
MRTIVALLILAGCGPSPDSVMWGCQLDVQKGNAGKSGEALAEKIRDIDACMEARGYRRDRDNRACQSGEAKSSCYLRR